LKRLWALHPLRNRRLEGPGKENRRFVFRLRRSECAFVFRLTGSSPVSGGGSRAGPKPPGFRGELRAAPNFSTEIKELASFFCAEGTNRPFRSGLSAFAACLL